MQPRHWCYRECLAWCVWACPQALPACSCAHVSQAGPATWPAWLRPAGALPAAERGCACGQAAVEEGGRVLARDRVSFQVATRVKAQQAGQAVGGAAAQHAGLPSTAP